MSKTKLKRMLIITIALYFTLTAVGYAPSIFMLFALSAIPVYLGFKKIKPLVIGCALFLLVVIFTLGSVETTFATLSALFNLAIAVVIATATAMYFMKKSKITRKLL